jgi:CheY-like chemotaxis protein
VRILIIEDDMITAADLTATLEEGGHEVVAVADTGRGAVASAERVKPDVALVDITLRDGDTGLCAARALRQLHQVPSILISAERNLGRQAEMVGAIAYVPKPARASDVLKLVDRLESIPSSFC